MKVCLSGMIKVKANNLPAMKLWKVDGLLRVVWVRSSTSVALGTKGNILVYLTEK